MKLVKPSFSILAIMAEGTQLELIEHAGRTCYKSEDKITSKSAKKFVEMLCKHGHESVLEHSSMTVKFIIDRGVSHELVRHRLASFSQESTRYCNYKGGVTFVIPPWVNIPEGDYEYEVDERVGRNVAEIAWYLSMLRSEYVYQKLLFNNWSPQYARSVLPNSLKTEVVMTANFREWKHVLTLRTEKPAHPQMREIMLPLLKQSKELIPVIFDDIEEE